MLCRLMQLAVVAVSVCGIAVGFWIIPSWGKAIIGANPEFSAWYWPWLVFSWIVGLPCFAVLIFIWKVAVAIKQEAVFTLLTAKWIKTASILIFVDVAVFFCGNVLFVCLNMSHPGILLASMLADILAVSLGLLAAILSRYITKAAALQEVSEGMI